MPQEILINAGAAETRIAVVEDGRLQALTSELTLGEDHGASRSRIGEILLGRVRKVVPAVQAAFVDIGMERAGFLALREAAALNPAIKEGEIGDYLREGDAVLVQIVKDTIGDKGALQRREHREPPRQGDARREPRGSPVSARRCSPRKACCRKDRG